MPASHSLAGHAGVQSGLVQRVFSFPSACLTPSHARMKPLRLVGCLALSCALFACAGLEKGKDKPKDKSREPVIKDAGGDVSFQSFLGRLRKAVAAHDVPE